MLYNLVCHFQERLDNLLRKELPIILKDKTSSANQISNSKIRRLIIAGAVSVNSNQIRVPSFEVHKGSTVSVVLESEKFFFEKQNDDIKFDVKDEDVLFEDEYLIVINKPAHFPTEETIVKGRDNLHNAVVRYLHSKNPTLRNPPYAGIMHRLDRETSGVILFTKTRTINSAIHDLFDSGDGATSEKVKRIFKTYVACVCFPKKTIDEKFSVNNFIGRISAKSQAGKWGILPKEKGGQKAITDFEVFMKKNDRLYLYAHPITGRTHQIRVHLASLGLPIIGDELYGGKKSSRMALHAFRLEFIHPITKKPLCIEAPLPKEF